MKISSNGRSYWRMSSCHIFLMLSPPHPLQNPVLNSTLSRFMGSLGNSEYIVLISKNSIYLLSLSKFLRTTGFESDPPSSPAYLVDSSNRLEFVYLSTNQKNFWHSSMDPGTAKTSKIFHLLRHTSWHWLKIPFLARLRYQKLGQV